MLSEVSGRFNGGKGGASSCLEDFSSPPLLLSPTMLFRLVRVRERRLSEARLLVLASLALLINEFERASCGSVGRQFGRGATADWAI